MYRVLIITVTLAFLGSCGAKKESITIAINQWPGYEFLYLAEQNGFFDDVGLDIELVQVGSLADSQRAYVDGRVDGFASTVIEAVQASLISERPLFIALVTDYSNGGDVIVTSKNYPDLKSLTGKKVGAEVSALGIFVLQRALTLHELDMSDVELVNVEQLDGISSLEDGVIDAFVTYPPASIKVLEDPNYHQIFSSAETPREILDTVSLSREVLKNEPKVVEKLLQAWQLALEHAEKHPQQSYQLMAKREGISADEFTDVLNDIEILDEKAQREILSKPDQLQALALSVCETLKSIGSIITSCEKLPRLVK